MSAAADSENSQGTRGRADHLREYQWQPGESGNPGGRPKSLMKQVRETLALEEAAITIAEMIREKHPVIVKEYMAREWPVTNRHELSGPDGAPIQAQAKPIDWSKLDEGDREALRKIRDKLMTPPRPGLGDE